MKTTYPTVGVQKAQQTLPTLCRSGKGYLITNHGEPAAVLLSIGDYESLMETLDVLSDKKAMAALQAARSGKLKYKKLDLDDDNFGL